MKYALAMSAAFLVALGQHNAAVAQTGTPIELVRQAVAAEGGAEALSALKGVEIKGEAKFWEPEQSKTAGGEPRYLGDGTFTFTWNLADGQAKMDWDRDQKYPDPPVKMKFSEIVTPAGGWVADDKGARAMSSIRVATHMRELLRASPTLLLKAMNNPASVRAAPNQQIATPKEEAPAGAARKAVQKVKDQLFGRRPAVTVAEGGTNFVVIFDPRSKLPMAVRTRDDDNIHGDSNYDLVFGDWKAVGNVKIAHSLSYQLDGIEVAKLTYKEVSANPTIAPDTFAAPDAVKSALKTPAAADKVPYQWVIRRLFLTRFTDADTIIYAPPSTGLKLTELSPTVQHVQGGGANNLIVEMKDHLVVVDAPYGELQSRAVIDLAKAKYPGKPIKYLVLTHHHMDHTGGTRTYVAEGATVLVPAPDKRHFDRYLAKAHTVTPDEMQKKRGVRVRVEEVRDTRTLKDDTNEVRLYNIPNPHADGFLLVHVAKDNIVYVTDLISPRGTIERSPGTIAVGDALRKYSITGATIAGGHGTVTKQAEIEPTLAAESTH